MSTLGPGSVHQSPDTKKYVFLTTHLLKCVVKSFTKIFYFTD